MQNTRIYTACFVGLGLWAATPAPTDAQSVESRQVTIAVMDDYPAFDSLVTRRHPRARPVAAIAIRRYLAIDPASSILLNPAHLDVNTLARAVAALARCPQASQDSLVSDDVPIAPASRPDAAPGPDAPRIAAWLNELRAQPTSEPRRVGGGMSRQSITVAAAVCVSPVPLRRTLPGWRPPAAAPPNPGAAVPPPATHR